MKLNNAQDAIKQAIEGGYDADRFIRARGTGKNFPAIEFRFDEKFQNDSAVFLDPLFWQALGKARGWPHKERAAGGGTLVFDWINYAIAWFECRMENGDESAFWQSLP